jgi:hypothetical protein
MSPADIVQTFSSAYSSTKMKAKQAAAIASAAMSNIPASTVVRGVSTKPQGFVTRP